MIYNQALERPLGKQIQLKTVLPESVTYSESLGVPV